MGDIGKEVAFVEALNVYVHGHMYVCLLYTGVKILKNFTFAGCGVRTISITIKNLTCFELHNT
jgi:hypothetical protein